MVTLNDLDNFVRDRHLDYAIAGIEIGDPTYEWEEAHHPDPECLGGTKTVPLLRKDHAVHGVLQSEVFQHPCIYGWEANYLEGELYDLCKKWHKEKGRRLGLSFGKENGVKGSKTQQDLQIGIYNPEYRSSEEFQQAQRRGASNSGKSQVRDGLGMFNPEYTRSEKYKQDKSNAGRIGSESTNIQKWMCLETGFISNPGNLSKYQKKRGIDTSKRVRLTPEEVAFIYLWEP